MANNKMAIPTLLIAMLVFVAFAQTGEALTECAKQCMPVCLKEQGATIPVCEAACEGYCKQAAAGSDTGGGNVV